MKITENFMHRIRKRLTHKAATHIHTNRGGTTTNSANFRLKKRQEILSIEGRAQQANTQGSTTRSDNKNILLISRGEILPYLHNFFQWKMRKSDKTTTMIFASTHN